jgi:hydrogenase expression/formation protein HypE
MKAGKLNPQDLKDIIENNKGIVRDDVRIHSGIGEDCSVVEFGDYECVLSTDPITGADANVGRLAVHINCNDIASCGVEPLGILVTILAPESSSMEDIKNVMEEVSQEAKDLKLEILGGHTEVTAAVNKLIVSCTVIGKGLKGRAVSTAGAQIGDDIIVTKHLALEGTTIAVNDFGERLQGVLREDEISRAKDYIRDISVVKEGVIAGTFGVNAMHDITEGGVLGALWEMAEAAGVGFKVYEEKMPLTTITKKVCAALKIDPLKFISSGSMLITAKRGEHLVDLLVQQGINAAIIGNITEGRGILVRCGNETEVQPPERDELFKL